LLLDLLNKQCVETRRTDGFLRFALGVRSPDRKDYFKSKLFITPEETRLKMRTNKTMYNDHSNNKGDHLLAIKDNVEN
jgi:hypothetical protein